MNPTRRVLLALVTGLAAGVGIALTGDPGFLGIAAIVEPIGTLWVNAIRMTVVPLVGALLVTGIASSTVGTVGRVGGHAMAWFAVLVGAGALLTALVAPPLLGLANFDAAAFDTLREGVTGTVELPPFRDWVVNLIPTNPVRAASDGSMLPLIVFLVLFAFAIRRIGAPHREALLTVLTAIAKAMLVIVEWILAVAPVGVFCLVVPLAARTGIDLVRAMGAFIAVASGLIVIAGIGLYPLASLFGGVRVREFARACARAQAVAFSTRSSLASLPAMLDAAERDLRLPAHVSGMVLPVAVSLFKFASPIARMTGTYFVAQLYGIDLGAVEIAAIAAAVAGLSFYSPGIPSGGLFIMTPIYVALQLPIEGIGLLIALDLIPDMFITLGNVTADLAVAVILGRPSRRAGRGNADGGSRKGGSAGIPPRRGTDG